MKFPINKIIFLYILICINTSFAATDSQANAQINTAQENPYALWDAAKAIGMSNTEKDNAQKTAILDYASTNQKEIPEDNRAKDLLLEKYKKELSAIAMPGFDSLNLGAKVKSYKVESPDGNGFIFISSLTKDDKKLLATNNSNKFWLFDIADIANIKLLRNFEAKESFRYSEHNISKNGKLMICENKLLDTTSGKILFTFEDYHSFRDIFSLSADGSLVVASSRDSSDDNSRFKVEIWRIDDKENVIKAIGDSKTFLNRDLIKIIFDYNGLVNKLNEFLFDILIDFDQRVELSSDGTICLIPSRNRSSESCRRHPLIMVYDKSNNNVVSKTYPKNNIISDIQISPNSRFILFKHNWACSFLDFRKFLKEGFYDNDKELIPSKFCRPDFSNDGQFLVYSDGRNFLINKISDNLKLERVCSMMYSREIQKIKIKVSNNCEFIIANSYEGKIEILDISNTWIMEELSLVQLVYIINIYNRIGNYDDIDKIFANMDPRFVKRLKDYFAPRQ